MIEAGQTFPVVCIYAAEDGKSHLVDLALPAVGRGADPNGATPWIGLLGAREWGVVVSDGSTYGDSTHGDWHTASHVGLSIVLQGAWEIEAGSGQRRALSAGNVLLMFDTTGQGHRSRLAAQQPCVVMGMALDDDARGQLGRLLRDAVADTAAPTMKE